MKNIRIFYMNIFIFLVVKFSIYLNRRVFEMRCPCPKVNFLTFTFRYGVTKTRLYSFDPLKPHFYTVKLGFTGVYNNFLISAQKHRLWVLVRTALLRRFLKAPSIFILSKNMKTTKCFHLKKFIFFGGKIINIFEYTCFPNGKHI